MKDEKLERYVLASLLKTNKKQLAFILRPDDFQNRQHRIIFELLIDRIDKGQKVDMTLLDDPSIKDADTMVAISDVFVADVTDDNGVLEEKIDELCRISDLRYAHKKASAMKNAIESGKLNNLNHAVDFLTNVSDDLVMRHPKEMDVSLGSSVVSALQQVERQKTEQKIKTGITSIDRFLYGGIKLGELVIFAARPNVGKSIFTIMPAIQASANGLDVLFAVNEMDKSQTSLRMLSHLSGVDMNAIEGHIPFMTADGDSLAMACDAMKHMPITFLENAYKVEEIEKILKTRQKINKPIRLVIVDMAGRMSTEKKVRDEREQVNEVSRNLFRMSKKYHCTIIGTVQINRAGEMSEEPLLRHLKESGRWEEDADKVFMMWADKENKERRYISLKKNRTGRKEHKASVILDGRHMIFKEVE